MNHRALTLVPMAVLIGGPNVRGQCAATPLVISAGSPFPRYSLNMAYDSDRGRIVLLGEPIYATVREVWEWDGDWSRKAPSTGPAEGVPLAFDQARGVTVAYAGTTWLWDGSVWAQSAAPAAPGDRTGAQMAYDVARQRAVMFGGGTGSPLPRDTWTWDGVQWTPASIQGPPGMMDHAMAYDPGLRQTILVSTTTSGVTWGWDGTQWLQPLQSRPLLQGVTATFDDAVGSVVAMGIPTSNVSNFWGYHPTGWSMLPAAPLPQRISYKVCYNAARSELLLVGGHDYGHPQIYEYFNSWVWDGTQWRQRDTVGHRSDALVMSDDARGRLVISGGWLEDEDTGTSDTFTWGCMGAV